jgi:hypothetical protein
MICNKCKESVSDISLNNHMVFCDTDYLIITKEDEQK